MPILSARRAKALPRSAERRARSGRAPRRAWTLADFPAYDRAERAADGAVHVVGVSAGLAAVCWLTLRIAPAATLQRGVTLLVYSFGLLGMLAASAAYNLAGPGRAKAVLRRLDHAMIFVMIAGSYTPFALNALSPPLGVPLCVAAWTVAALGVALKLACPLHCERLSLALYLGMGWMLVFVIRSLVASVSGEVLGLLLAGGLVYSLGVAVYGAGRLRFHNALWHAMVLVAAGLHLAAVSEVLAGWDRS
ncbi:MAG: hemolysin III family protein [Acetobacteraceae bacterium]|nr:hemolysin III family protein [Acetobacteraceae bacterium]